MEAFWVKIRARKALLGQQDTEPHMGGCQCIEKGGVNVSKGGVNVMVPIFQGYYPSLGLGLRLACARTFDAGLTGGW